MLPQHSIPPSRAEPEAHTARTFSEKTSDTLARLEGFTKRVYMHVESLYSMQLRHESSCLRGLRRAGTCRYMRHAVKIPVEMQRGLDILSKTKLLHRKNEGADAPQAAYARPCPRIAIPNRGKKSHFAMNPRGRARDHEG